MKTLKTADKLNTQPLKRKIEIYIRGYSVYIVAKLTIVHKHHSAGRDLHHGS